MNVVKNRFYKNTLGIFAELVIAAALDTEETTGTSGQPSVTSITVGIAADPTPGDVINIVVDGVTYTHTVPVGDETTQQAHDAILALLQANSQGFEVTAHSGTTSSVYQLAWGIGTANNGKVVSSTETGSTFTAFADATFAGGVNADAAASDNYKDFVANSNAGTIWAFWTEPDANGEQVALVTGDTKKPENQGKKFFFGWKDSAGLARTTTDIPVAGLQFKSTPYNAGTLQVSDVNLGGTMAAGQILHLRLIETTSTQLPYPSYEYNTPYNTSTTQTITDIAAKVNAELVSNRPIATASGSGTELTLTGTDRARTFKVVMYIETTPAQPVDATVITFPGTGTAAAVAPRGDATSIAELEEYYTIYSGGINYAPEGTRIPEWQNLSSNRGAISQWGICMVYAHKMEQGAVRDHYSHPYVIIAVPTGSETVLAAL